MNMLRIESTNEQLRNRISLTFQQSMPTHDLTDTHSALTKATISSKKKWVPAYFHLNFGHLEHFLVHFPLPNAMHIHIHTSSIKMLWRANKIWKEEEEEDEGDTNWVENQDIWIKVKYMYKCISLCRDRCEQSTNANGWMRTILGPFGPKLS